MRSRPYALTIVLGMSLATCLMTARADVMPEAEYDGQEIGAVTEFTGLSRFPDHAFYVFPAYCTEALARFSASTESDDDNPEIDPRFYYDQQHEDRPNYLVVSDGELPQWTSGSTPCNSSALYAIAREVAAGVDLDHMKLGELHRFFTEDPRVFRSTFEFQDSPLYAPKYARLRSVREVVRVVRVGPTEITAVLDSATYRFEDGSEQTLKLAHAGRPPALPFKPLKPDKIDKYAAKYAKWEARQPLAAPPAPRLPVIEEDTAAAEPPAAPAADATTGAQPAAPSADATAGTDPPAAAPLAAAPAVASPPPAAPVPVAASPEPPPAPVVAAPDEDVLEDMDEEPGPAADPMWPLGAAIAGGLALVVIVALTRRPRAGA